MTHITFVITKLPFHTKLMHRSSVEEARQGERLSEELGWNLDTRSASCFLPLFTVNPCLKSATQAMLLDG
jgi:hypothetical protein